MAIAGIVVRLLTHTWWFLWIGVAVLAMGIALGHFAMLIPMLRVSKAMKQLGRQIGGFEWYAGAALAALLPYRRKMFLFGPKVCEWPAVLLMTRAAFFIGCSLSLVKQNAAEEILKEAAKPGEWRTKFSDIIKDLERRLLNVDTATATFENFFPEVKLGRGKELLLSQHECTTSIGQRVLLGLICGVLFPGITLLMLKAFVGQERQWTNLGVGGLRVDSSPLLRSVEEAYAHAKSIYEAWQQYYSGKVEVE